MTRRSSWLNPFLYPFAEQFFQRWKQNRKPSDVAKEFDLSLRSVQRLYRRFEDQGEDGISPDYARCGQHQSQRTPESLVQKAQELREQHPTWGAELIRVFLEAAQPLPTA